MVQQYRSWNNTHEDKITWAECVRRGFALIVNEKKNEPIDMVIDELPFQARNRIKELVAKLSTMSQEIEKLKGGQSNWLGGKNGNV